MSKVMGAFVGFCLLLLSIVAVVDIKSHRDADLLLKEDAKAQLIAICFAAREVIDVPKLFEMNREEDIRNNPDYAKTWQKLQHIATNVGAKNVYVMKKIGDNYFTIYDTEKDYPDGFTRYTPTAVHASAFSGQASADMLQGEDGYDSRIGTGAVPLWRGGKVIGIVCADLMDRLLPKFHGMARFNSLLLVGSLLTAMAGMLAIVRHLLRRIKSMQDELVRMARYDTVTGLPNRLHLVEYLEDLCTNHRGVPFALMFIDLDNFKQVNDTAGHDAGDALLRKIGEYLAGGPGSRKGSRVFRPSAGRLNIAARVGGDEFVVVLPNIGDASAAEKAALDILDGLRLEKIDDHIEKFKVGMSIGIALYPSQTEDYNVLVKYADMAMYHAKHAGKSCFRIYSDEMPAKNEK